eukprot:COSAG02_NODE_1137_length_14313_cov_6.111369_8_plen_111_part_00
MLDHRTKALVDAIGFGVDQPNEVRPGPELELEPEPEPEPRPQPVPVVPADAHPSASNSDQTSLCATDRGVMELDQSCLAAVITAQQLAKQMLEMTNRWMTLIDEREENSV